MGIKAAKRKLETGKATQKLKKAKVVEPVESSEALEALLSEDISDSSEDELDQINTSGVQPEDDDEESEADELDELDKMSEDDNDDEKDAEDDDEDDEDEEQQNDDKPKVSPEERAKARKEQKEELKKRKLQRKAGTEVQQIKKLWEKLRCTKPVPSKEERDKLANEIWTLSQDVILDLVLKHDALRVVQTLVKYSPQERRDKIVTALKGHFYDLATSAYGKYLLVKLLHYGLKNAKQMVINELHGKLRKLMRHREGAYVVEDLFVLYLTQAQRKQMMREFWGSEYAVFKELGQDQTVVDVIHSLLEKKHLIMTNLYGTISASVNKGSTGFQILHAAMKEYVACLVDDVEANNSQIREFVELLQEQVAELIHTPEGLDVACTLIALATAKERRNIVKHLKLHAADMVKNEHGNLVLITLYMVTDDTVMLTKAFGEELYGPEVLPGVVVDKWGRRAPLYILRGLDKRYFNPRVQALLKGYETLAYAHTTKKPQDKRQAELREAMVPMFYLSILALGDDFSLFFLENLAAQFITELILTPGDYPQRQELLDKVVEVSTSGDVREDHHLLNHAVFVLRALKLLIQGTQYKFNHELKKVEKVDGVDAIPGTGVDLAERIAKDIDVAQWVAANQGAFTVVALYEVLLLAKLSEAKKLQKQVKKLAKTIKEDTDNKGAQLLLEIV